MYFTERFNADILHSIVENERNLRNKLYFIPDRENDPFLLAKKILRNSEDGKIKVIHRQINNQGRRVAAGGLSLANLARQLRHAACIDIYIDIDVENAHPVILRFICNQHKIDCEFLDEYVEDREKLLSTAENLHEVLRAIDADLRRSIKSLMWMVGILVTIGITAFGWHAKQPAHDEMGKAAERLETKMDALLKADSKPVDNIHGSNKM